LMRVDGRPPMNPIRHAMVANSRLCSRLRYRTSGIYQFSV
jgi:hypothetical protein